MEAIYKNLQKRERSRNFSFLPQAREEKLRQGINYAKETNDYCSGCFSGYSVYGIGSSIDVQQVYIGDEHSGRADDCFGIWGGL